MVNQSIKLEDSIIDDRYDFILTKDWLMLNAGMLLLKCSDWMENFLAQVYDAKEFDQVRWIGCVNVSGRVTGSGDLIQNFLPSDCFRFHFRRVRWIRVHSKRI